MLFKEWMKTLTLLGRSVPLLCSVRASPGKRDTALGPELPSGVQRIYGMAEVNKVKKLM